MELAAAPGFVRHPGFCVGKHQQGTGAREQQQHQPQQGDGQTAGGLRERQLQLPPGHLALCVAESIS